MTDIGEAASRSRRKILVACAVLLVLGITVALVTNFKVSNRVKYLQTDVHFPEYVYKAAFAGDYTIGLTEHSVYVLDDKGTVLEKIESDIPINNVDVVDNNTLVIPRKNGLSFVSLEDVGRILKTTESSVDLYAPFISALKSDCVFYGRSIENSFIHSDSEEIKLTTDGEGSVLTAAWVSESRLAVVSHSTGSTALHMFSVDGREFYQKNFTGYHEFDFFEAKLVAAKDNEVHIFDIADSVTQIDTITTGAGIVDVAFSHSGDSLIIILNKLTGIIYDFDTSTKKPIRVGIREISSVFDEGFLLGTGFTVTKIVLTE